MKFFQQKWKACDEKPLMAIISICLLVSMFLTGFGAISFTAVAAEGASDQDAASDYSFYQLSNTVAAALSTAMADKDDPVGTLETYFGKVSPAAAGGLLGYTSKDNNRGVWGMFMNALSLGANTKEYSSLAAGENSLLKAVGSGYSYDGVFLSYVFLGAAMNLTGLDNSDSGAAFFSSLKRGALGAVAQMAFQFASVVTAIFGFAIDVLKFFNPFQFFAKAGQYQTITYNGFVDEMAAIPGGTVFGLESSTLLGGLTELISRFWDILHICGLVFAGLALAIVLFKFFMPGHFGRIEGLRKWFIQALFVIGGIAILGGTYTTVLDWIDDMTSGGNTAAVKVIASTFFDFESWAMAGMPTDGVTFKLSYDSGTLSYDAVDVQSLCLKLNANANSSLSSIADMGWTSGVDDEVAAASVYGSMVTDIQEMYGESASDSEDSTVSWAFDMLSRYMSGSRVYSSSYESAWKARCWASDSVGSALAEYINYSDDVDSILSDTPLLSYRFSIARVYNLDDSGVGVMNPFARGTGSTTAISDTSIEYGMGSVPSAFQNLTRSDTKSGELTHSNIGDLSAMSVYNYLNTTFNPSSFIVYSSENSTSEYVRDTHYSVNLIGSGWSSIVIFMLCILLLISYAILGFFYGLSIIMTNITRGFRLIMAVPGAMLGSLQSIAKVVSYTVLMIVEILATILLYDICAEVLYVFANVIAVGFQNALSNVFEGAVIVILSPIIGIVTCLALIWFLIRAIRLRKPVVKMFEEMADNVVQKFILGASAAAAGGAAATAGAGAAAAGAVAGAGAAAKKRKGVLGKIQAKNARQDAEAEMRISQMFGGGSSAVAEENRLDQYAKDKKNAKREAREAKIEAGKKAVVGGAEVMAGMAMGNPMLAAQGAKNIAQGAGDMQQADINRDAQIAASANRAAGSLGSKDTKTAETAAGLYKPVEKMDVVQEAQGATKTAIHGAIAAGMVAGVGAGAGASNADLAAGAGGQPVGVDPNTPSGGQHAPNAVLETVRQGQTVGTQRDTVYARGADGQITQVPNVGQDTVDMQGRTCVARVGNRDVVYQGETGHVAMHLNNDGSWKATGGDATPEETLQIVKRVNAVTASEMNMRAVQNGSNVRYAVDNETGNIVPVTQKMVKGRNITDLDVADEVRQTRAGRNATLPETPMSVSDKMQHVTQHEAIGVDTMTAIRREQSGQYVSDAAPQTIRQSQTAEVQRDAVYARGANGQITQVPNVGQDTVDMQGRTCVARVGSQDVVYQGETGHVAMHLNNDGSWKATGGDATPEETLQIVKRVNAVTASEMNMKAVQNGSGVRYAVDNETGNIVPVTQKTVNGRNITDLNVADEVRQTRAGRNATLPETPVSVSDKMQHVTQHEAIGVDTMTAIRREQSGQTVNLNDADANIQASDVQHQTIRTGTEVNVQDQSRIVESGGKQLRQPDYKQNIVSAENQETTQNIRRGVNVNMQEELRVNGTSGKMLGNMQFEPVSGPGDQNEMIHGGTRRVTVTQDPTQINYVGGNGGNISMPRGEVRTSDITNERIVRVNNKTSVQQGSVYDAGLGQQGASNVPGGSGKRTTVFVTDDTQVQHQQKTTHQFVGGGGVMGGGQMGGSGSFSGSQNTERVTDETVVQHQQQIRHEKGGQFDSGYRGGSGSFSGSQNTERVTDETVVQHQQQIRHEKGGQFDSGYSGGSGSFSGSQNTKRVTDETVVEHVQNVKHESGGLNVSSTLKDEGSGLGEGIADGSKVTKRKRKK